MEQTAQTRPEGRSGWVPVSGGHGDGHEPDDLAHRMWRHPVTVALWRRRTPLLVALATLVGLLLAFRGRPVVLYDDAAITMRYAVRISGGDGWTYNPGDRTNGASAPLYTMALAALDYVGMNVVTAARLVGAASFAATFGLVAWLGSRIVGIAGGVLSLGFLAFWVDFQTQGLSGMESPLAAALGLAVVLALREERDTLAGILLGLALVTKLDAGLLALAVAAGYLAVLRRAPWRVAAVSAVVFAPWLAFATAYFGTPIPNSFSQKASGAVSNPAADVTPTWILESLDAQNVLLVSILGLAAAGVAVRLRRSDPRAALALVVCVAWPVLHGLAFSFTDLGDLHPWYLTVLYPPLSIAAGCTLGYAMALVRDASGLAKAVTGLAVASVAAVAVGAHQPNGGAVRPVVDTLVQGHQRGEYEAFEEARREAGRQLAALAAPEDVIATCFGWIAFEARENTILETCPGTLNTRDPVGAPRWYTTVSYPGTTPPELPDDHHIATTVISEVGQGGRVDVIEIVPPTG